MRVRPGLIAAVVVCLCAVASAADAKTVLKVEYGWGEMVRPGRWSPVLVTLSDPDNPNAVIELSATHDAMHNMRVRQFVGTIGAQPKTFALYVPVSGYFGYGALPVAVTVRNPDDNNRLLAKTDPDDPTLTPRAQNVDPAGGLIAVSGRRAILTALQGQPPNRVMAGFLEQDALPLAAVGYDAADVLLLNAPDLGRLTDEQQRAIVDWVRGGGNLLLCPGENLVPEKSPLVDVLPCRIGGATTASLTADQLSAAGLPRRFGNLGARELKPVEGAEPLRLFGAGAGSDATVAYRRRLGLGRVLVSPVGLPDLQFDDDPRARAFWRPVLAGMIDLTDPPAPSTQPQTSYAPSDYDLRFQREALAENAVVDMLGGVPGAGSFGFSYVVAVLIGLMVIVGPVDWFVLRLLRRQAWTWVTTTGWIALITLGALYIGHVFRSGDLHYRTYAVVDQVDGATVARTDYVGIYAPRTAGYEVAVEPAAWWEPAAPGMHYYGGRGHVDVAFGQTYRGNAPHPMRINVWSLRFLKSNTLATGPAAIEATLKHGETDAAGRVRFTGTIKNPGERPLKLLWLSASKGSTRIDVEVAAGATVPVDVRTEPPTVLTPEERANYNEIIRERRANPREPAEVGAGVAGARFHRMDQITGAGSPGDQVLIVAQQLNPQPAATLKTGQPIEQHWQVIRAVVPVQKQ